MCSMTTLAQRCISVTAMDTVSHDGKAARPGAAAQSVLAPTSPPSAPALPEDDDDDDDFVLDLNDMLAAATEEDAAQWEQASTISEHSRFQGLDAFRSQSRSTQVCWHRMRWIRSFGIAADM